MKIYAILTVAFKTLVDFLSVQDTAWGHGVAKTDLPRQSCQDRVAEIELPRQYCQDIVAKTELPRQSCQNRRKCSRIWYFHYLFMDGNVRFQHLLLGDCE